MPLLVPLNTLSPEKQRAYYRKHLQKIEDRARVEKAQRERMAEAVDSKEYWDRKPTLYVHNEGDRPIVVVGGGHTTRAELREIAMRRAERPQFPNGRRIVQPDPWLTLKTAAEQKLRDSIGLKVFHIKNNPLAKG